MKENYSLFLTKKIAQEIQKDLSGIFYSFFPFDKLASKKPKNVRDRVFSPENTILTMILTMIQEDKTLQNSVNIYSLIHKKNQKRIAEMQERFEQEKELGKKEKKAGRPRTGIGRIAKSKTQEISKDTSAYSQARIRLPEESLRTVFEDSKDFADIQYPNKWHGYRVFIADGTYLQMQDTEALRSKFRNKKAGAYPRGLLEAIIEQGSGAIYDYELDSDSKSELELLSRMICTIPQGSLLLADDLYNCFAIFSLLKQRGVEIIVPGKRTRNYRVVETIAEGDEIVELTKSNNSEWLHGKQIEDKKLLMRRIEYENPQKEGEKSVIYTSLMDKTLSKTDIILKYECRWDIEISIREIKTIMDVNVVRAKSPEMAGKEVASSLIAYNYIRRKIAEGTENSVFSPETDIIQKYFEINSPVLLDRLGRRYTKWSVGRRGYTDEGNNQVHNPAAERSSLSKKNERAKI